MSLVRRPRPARLRVVLTLAALAAAVVIPAPAATALDVGPEVSAGTLLPPLYRPAPGYIELRTVSPSYIGFSAGYGETDEYAEPAIEVHRVSDGTRAPSLALASLSMATANEPRLSGTARVQVVPATTASGPESVEVRDLETGDLRWSRSIPADQQVIDSGASWVLTVDTPGQP